MEGKSKYLFITLAVGLGLTLSLLWSVGYTQSAYADSGVLYVATDGDDANDCASIATRCRTIQRAVDMARPGDEIRVAAGVYDGVSTRAGTTQTVYISKTVTIRGGFTTANWATPDPVANPTTLDAQGQGRVVYIIGDVSPTVEGLRMTGGDATGLGGDPWGNDAGGGVYVYRATATISNCVVYSNVASNAASGSGGGVFLRSSDATLSGNEVVSNTASTASYADGGGVFLWGSAATLEGNTVRGNVASIAGRGYGGGMYLLNSAAMLSSNSVVSNTAGAANHGSGGGLYLSYSDAMLENNMIVDNTASATDQGYAGGLYLINSDAILRGNTVQGNIASIAGRGYGGGLYLRQSAATLNGNRIIHNTTGSADRGYGGGLLVQQSSPITLTNTLIAGNHARTEGSGLWFGGADTDATSGQLLHTTIADNRGSGQGVFLSDYATLAFTNVIIAGHPSVGITVTTGSTATLEATLWYLNGSDTGGGGNITTGAINVYGNPAFVDPPAGNYHLAAGSAAIDRGVDAGVATDLDNNLRPIGRPDLGAYEWRTQMYLPALLRNN
ncbi:MAG: DUF1565 domain-containing protein [Chloroflexi bacterium]|nr:DUF1565 domain-containing protein [Chloroflexota bacterium]